jgi:hypothetical protein
MAERPVHEIRLGKVKAAIWRNEGEYGTRHNVTFSRIYKTEERWENSASFGRDDLPLVEKVAALAHLWIYEHAERDSTDSDESERSQNGRSGKRAVAAR